MAHSPHGTQGRSGLLLHANHSPRRHSSKVRGGTSMLLCFWSPKIPFPKAKWACCHGPVGDRGAQARTCLAHHLLPPQDSASPKRGQEGEQRSALSRGLRALQDLLCTGSSPGHVGASKLARHRALGGLPDLLVTYHSPGLSGVSQTCWAPATHPDRSCLLQCEHRHTHTHTRSYINIYTCACNLPTTCTQSTHPYPSKYIFGCIHPPHIHTHIDMYVSMCTYSVCNPMNKYTPPHTQTCKYIHTYIYTPSPPHQTRDPGTARHTPASLPAPQLPHPGDAHQRQP